MTDSILNTIKKMLGVDPTYDAFDIDIITHINGAFMALFQLGVGGNTPFSITGANEKWSDFIDEEKYQLVKTYIYFRVKLAFDPPSSSFVLDSMKEQMREAEWRLNMQSEEFIKEGDDNEQN